MKTFAWFVACAGILSAIAEGGFAEEGAPALTCPLVKAAPRVDGKIEDAEWSGASVMTGFVTPGKNALVRLQAVFRVMRTEDALYAAVRVPMPPGVKPRGSVTKHDGPVWNDDAVEIFLDPGLTRRNYYQFIGTSKGVTWESHRQDGKWNADWDFKTSTGDGGWEAEFRIPFSSLGVKAPTPGDEWGFNVCCDRQTPSRGLSSWARVKKGFHDPRNFGRLVFGEPAVRLVSIGVSREGRLTVKGGIARGPAAAVMTVRKDGKELTQERRQAQPGKPLTLDWEYTLPQKGGRPAPGDYEFVSDVRSADGRLSWAKSVIPLHVEPAMELAIHPFYLVEKVLVVDVTTRDIGAPFDQAAVVVEIRSEDGGKTLMSKRLDPAPAGGKGTVEFGVADLAAGKYVLRASAVRRAGGGLLMEVSKSFEKPPRPKWLGSKEGVTDEVLPPWTPIETDGTNVKPWGREYVYDSRPFPSRVVTRGESVLSGPIRFSVRAGGVTAEVQGGRVKVTERSPGLVKLAYATTAGGMKFEEEIAVEYDGMVRHAFRFVPAGGVRVERLTLEIPFKAEHAKYLYHYPGRWRSAYNAGALPADGFVSAFRPFIWLGDEDRGLAWFSECDRNWFPAEEDKAVEILRKGDEVILRLNIIGKPQTITGPLEYTFGLQATPVKPVVEDVWDMRIIHAGNYGIEDRPYAGSATLTYPAEGNINPERGTLEMWVRSRLGWDVKVPEGVSRGLFNRDLFSVLLPGGEFWLYWNIDDRGLRFFVKEGKRYPILFGTRQKWKAGEVHHVALTWGDEVCIYVDGKLVAKRAYKGTTSPDTKGGRIIFGGKAGGFAIDEVRISDVPRTEFDLSRPPEADEHTLLLDHLDEAFQPDGERRTRPAKAAGGIGGVPDGAASFEPVKFGNGLRLYYEGPQKTALERFAELGVRTIVFHEHWTDIQNYTSTTHGERLRKLVKACHDRGIRLLLYFGYEMSDIAPEFPFYGEECLVYPRRGGYTRKPPQTAYVVCYRSPWQDFMADGIARMIDEYDIDGVYLDGTEWPWGCRNVRHGCGYRRPDGTVGPTYTFFATRRMMKRIYAIVKKRKPNGLVNVHNSTVMTIPTLAWATSSWDGEQFGGIERGPFALEVLPLDTFRCEFMGRQWGVPSEFLCYNRPYTYHEALSFTLLHDVLVRGSAERESKLWRAMDEFGRKQARFLPYWNNAGVVKTSAPEIKVSIWTRGAEGSMLVVSNLGKEERAVVVDLDLERLGLKPGARAIDALTGQPVSLKDGKLELTLGSLDWRMVRVR